MYLDRFRLPGRIALVTGGAGAIGRAICEALAEAGATVVVADQDHRAAEEAAAAVRGSDRAAEAAAFDVTDPDAVTAAIDAVAARHGRLDILVNNAGIARSETPAEEVADDHWRNVI